MAASSNFQKAASQTQNLLSKRSSERALQFRSAISKQESWSTVNWAQVAYSFERSASATVCQCHCKYSGTRIVQRIAQLAGCTRPASLVRYARDAGGHFDSRLEPC